MFKALIIGGLVFYGIVFLMFWAMCAAAARADRWAEEREQGKKKTLMLTIGGMRILKIVLDDVLKLSYYIKYLTKAGFPPSVQARPIKATRTESGFPAFLA